ncbi:lysophospholipase Plb2 [Aspergillus udagawae]|uniref:Lysophospholipase n=1 Tax=Aspergillus udagawae TaxID=91492 RepID=A0A8E0QWW5_9EURO|nr:lysophospholipase 2 [Aspergillus udagawae]GIC90248.1 lysophospholipase 2 [Aspergillus udagawae]
MYKYRLDLPSITLLYLFFLIVLLLPHSPAKGASLVTVPLNRALPNAPNGYTPEGEACPSNRPSVRNATSLSTAETSWLKARRNNTRDALRAFLSRVDLGSFNGSAYVDKHSANASTLPNIGIAVSGGGYRALMNGGGALQAFDNRTTNSTLKGQVGGILQSATYLSGLSGGSWLVGSIYMNNFSDVSSLRDNGSVWQFQDSIFSGPTQSTEWGISTAKYYSQLLSAVGGKSDAGYEVSITDYWGRSLSYQLINASEGGVSYTWSSIALSKDFQAGTVPMPLVIADGRAPGQILVPANTTVFEFNPWEFGSWDASLSAFVSLEFLGSNFSRGTLPTGEKCVRGFDNAGFIMGTSSSLFNQAFLHINDTGAPAAVTNAISGILGTIGSENNDIAVYKPNPFYRYASSSQYTTSPSLTLVDGGEDLQNIPLDPLLQPQRHVDVILALDSSADTTSRWPNGTSMVATYERNVQSSRTNSSLAFPSVPDQNTFVNLGLNNRPTFFGCNSSNITGSAPLVVYIPNAPYIYLSNVSTFDLQYNTSERNAIIENGYDVATLGNGTLDSNWPSCLACAILSRSFERTNTTIPDVCSTCFRNYCWNGTTNATTPGNYYPTLKLH